jgi:hypothetical protein
MYGTFQPAGTWSDFWRVKQFSLMRLTIRTHQLLSVCFGLDYVLQFFHRIWDCCDFTESQNEASNTFSSDEKQMRDGLLKEMSMDPLTDAEKVFLAGRYQVLMVFPSLLPWYLKTIELS